MEECRRQKLKMFILRSLVVPIITFNLIISLAHLVGLLSGLEFDYGALNRVYFDKGVQTVLLLSSVVVYYFMYRSKFPKFEHVSTKISHTITIVILAVATFWLSSNMELLMTLVIDVKQFTMLKVWYPVFAIMYALVLKYFLTVASEGGYIYVSFARWLTKNLNYYDMIYYAGLTSPVLK